MPSFEPILVVAVLLLLGVLAGKLSSRFGVPALLLFLLLGMLYERRHTRLIQEFGGLGRVAPLFGTAFVITALASIRKKQTPQSTAPGAVAAALSETREWLARHMPS